MKAYFDSIHDHQRPNRGGGSPRLRIVEPSTIVLSELGQGTRCQVIGAQGLAVQIGESASVTKAACAHFLGAEPWP